MSNHSLDQPLASAAPGAPPRGIDLRHLFHTLLDRAWIVLSVFVLVTLLTIAYLQRAPRIYAATATLQVEQQEQKILKFDRVVQEDLRSSETLRTILQTLKTRSLLERVAMNTKLGENPNFIEPGGDKLTTNQVAGMLDKLITVRLRTG